MTTLNRGEQTAAPIAPPLSDDERIEHLARRVRDGHSLNAAARAWLPGRGSPQEAQWSLAADLGLAGFATFVDLAKATLAHDAARREISEIAMAIANSRRALPEQEMGLFLSRVRALRGNPPGALLAQLGLAETAGWSLVAERLAEQLSPKTGVAR